MALCAPSLNGQSWHGKTLVSDPISCISFKYFRYSPNLSSKGSKKLSEMLGDILGNKKSPERYNFLSLSNKEICSGECPESVLTFHFPSFETISWPALIISNSGSSGVGV